MFHRHTVGGLGTEYRGDRNSRDALAQAFSDFTADIVVDFCCYSIAQLQIVTTALPKTVGQYVFVSTCDVFGYPLAKVPIPEAGPLTELSLQVAKYVRRVLTTTLPLAGDSIEQQVIDLWRSR